MDRDYNDIRDQKDKWENKDNLDIMSKLPTIRTNRKLRISW